MNRSAAGQEGGCAVILRQGEKVISWNELAFARLASLRWSIPPALNFS